MRLYGKPTRICNGAAYAASGTARALARAMQGWPRNRTPFALKLPALCAFCVLQARLWLRGQLVMIVSWFGSPVSGRALAVRAHLTTRTPSRTPGELASLNDLRPRAPPALTTLMRLAAQPIDAR